MFEGPPFVLFGPAHLTALLLIFALAVAMRRVAPSEDVSTLAKALALLLLVLVIVKPVIFVSVYQLPVPRSLPLDLCRINEFLCVYLLLKRSYRVFEIAWFLAMAGSVSALLMPDLANDFPDPRFVMFLVSHGASVLAVLYAVFGYGFRPTLRSVRNVLIFLGIYTLCIVAVNLLLDTNYLFLREKPAGASVLDYFGPWPFYVFGMIGIAVVACLLLYLPFAQRTEPAGPAR